MFSFIPGGLCHGLILFINNRYAFKYLSAFSEKGREVSG